MTTAWCGFGPHSFDQTFAKFVRKVHPLQKGHSERSSLREGNHSRNGTALEEDEALNDPGDWVR